MTPRRLAVAVLTALLAVVGVVGALTGYDGVALAALVGLAGVATAVTLDTNRRVSDATAEARRRGKADAAILKHAARADRLEQVAGAVDALARPMDVRRAVAVATKAVRKLETSVTKAIDRTDVAVAEVGSSIDRETEATVALSSAMESVSEDLARVASTAAETQKQVSVILPGMLLTESQALTQLQARFPTMVPLPVVGGWALNPTGLLWLVDMIERTKPELVVECGSGTSTFWIAATLKRNSKGRVVALDHLAKYADQTRNTLGRHGLADVAEVRHSPLVERATPRGPFQWYDVDPESLGTIDILLVDGPPNTTGPLARYPALPVLGERLAPDAWILVDDAERPAEHKAIKFWLEDDRSLERIGFAGSASEVLRRG